MTKRKLPKNFPIGKIKEIIVKGRKVKFLRKKKKGWGAWKIIR